LSDDKMKTIDDEVRDLKNEKKRLAKEKKELLSKAEILKPKLEMQTKDFLKWDNRHNVMTTPTCVCFVIFFSLTLIFSGGSVFVQAGLDNVAQAKLGAFIALSGVVFGFSYVFLLMGIISRSSRPQLEAIPLRAELQKALAEAASIESRIKQIETEEAELKTELKMRRKGLIPFVDRLRRKRFGTPEQVIKWKIVDMDMKNRFSRLKPREFEKLIRELFVKMGYEASLTPYTADFGADVVAKKGTDTIVIQVKKYSRENKVGSPEVQRLLGSMFKYKANKAIFVTTSEFTEEAREQARDAPIELWDYTVLNEKIEQHLLTKFREDCKRGVIKPSSAFMNTLKA